MKDDFFIIYEGDENDVHEFTSAAKSQKDAGPEPEHVVMGRERRRRALEAKERRQQARAAAREEKVRAKEAQRKAREAEYARQVAEYERAIARRAAEKEARRNGKAAPKNTSQKSSKQTAAKTSSAASTEGTPFAFTAGPCMMAIPMVIVGFLLILVGLVLFGIWYPAEWTAAADQMDNGRVKATMATFVVGFLVMLIGNVLSIPSVRAARSD